MRRFLTILLQFCITWIPVQAELFIASDKLSSTKITCICQDQMGYIWIGTEYGLNRYDGYRFIHFLHQPADTTSLYSNMVEEVFCDREGRLWIGTNETLLRYDYATNCFERYYFPKGQQPHVNSIIQTQKGEVLVGTSGYGVFQVLPHSRVLKALKNFQLDEYDTHFSHIHEDPAGGLWKSGANRLSYIPKGGGPIQLMQTAPTGFFELDGRTVALCRDRFLVYENGNADTEFIDISRLGTQAGFLTAIKDHSGNIYVGTHGGGLWWIPAGTRCLQRHSVTVQGFDLSASIVTALAEDRQRNIWIGCKQQGVVMIPSEKELFTSWSFSAQQQEIGTYVSSVCSGDNGIVWCTVHHKGVYGFDESGHIVAHPQAPHDVELIYRDVDGRYWLGTSHGLYDYNPLTGKARLVTDFECSAFNSMIDNGKGYMAISAFSKGMLVWDKKKKSFLHLDMNHRSDSIRGRLCNNWINTFTADRDGRIWIGTSSGISCYDPQNDTFRPFGWETLNAQRSCNAMQETREGDLLIGTDQGLMVWRRATNKLEELPGAESLKTLVINYLVQDAGGNLWCSTSKGIWHYQVSDRKWVSYVSGSGLAGYEYVNSVGLHTDEERLFFATNDGLITFSPQQVGIPQKPQAQVHLTGFYIGGNRISTLSFSDGERVTFHPVDESHHFRVSYFDNSFSLEFSLLNYTNAANVVFEHRLDGTSDWISNPIGQNSISFNHLASGTYQLEVRAIDNGVTSDSQFYEIVVTAPWYRSSWAYGFYLLISGGFIGLIGIVYQRRMNEQLEEDKMKFLINATHDIRSPLTLIMGPINKLRKSVLEIEMQGELDIIERNAQRILTLVNQILDVRKIDKQQMCLRCRETNMQEFLQTNCKFYEHYAEDRNIRFTFETKVTDTTIMAWIDRVQFEKVISNLLSNAFKYSYDYGDIVLTLSTGHDEYAKAYLKDYVEISVSDTGMGMQPHTIPHLFDRFYQGKTNKSAHIEGTGIGLNLCKMIVDMHHGIISGCNRKDGQKGSIFTVRLPLGKSHLSEKEIDTETDSPAGIRFKGGKPANSSKVLIVDDDEEIGMYIAKELSAYYYFTQCKNGKDGLKELLMNSYDLVISDVMMPEMDGFTMLRMIRSNGMINHLPVIMLTSKIDIDNRLKGLERGADAYLTKPFSIDELHALIDNLIAGRLRLRGKYSGVQHPKEKVKEIKVKGNDEQLMERIIASINSHIGDSDFNSDILCSEVGISRSHLHRKMKEMAGVPVSDFIRNIRMEQAARLLVEQKLNITQVAYTVGFSTLPHFSSVFHKYFGMSPKAFIEQESIKGKKI